MASEEAEDHVHLCAQAQLQHHLHGSVTAFAAVSKSLTDAWGSGLVKTGMLGSTAVPALAAAKVFCISNGQGRYFHPEERLVPIPFETSGPGYEHHVLPSVLEAAGGHGHGSTANDEFVRLDAALDSQKDTGAGKTGLNVPGRSPSQADFGGARLHVKSLVSANEVGYLNGLFDKGISKHNDFSREVNVAMDELPADFMQRIRRRAREELNITQPLFYETGKIREAHHTFLGHADNSFFDIESRVRLPLPNGMFRTWTLDVALNDPRNYTGGALNFVHPLPVQQLRPELGDGVLFESGVLNVHKVGKVTQGRRRVLLLWLHSEDVIGEHGQLAKDYQSMSTESGTTGVDPRSPALQDRRADVLRRWAAAHEGLVK